MYLHRFYMLLLVLGLLAGCQSSRPTFYFGFRPTPTPLASAGAPDSVAVTTLLASAVADRLAETGQPIAASAAARKSGNNHPLLAASQPILKRTAAERFAAGQCGKAAPRPAPIWHTAARAAHLKRPLSPAYPAGGSDNLFFLGGLALVGIGLAAGLMIGGWPGLVVGLALGIPGYLFLGRGYAGSWKSAGRPSSTFPAHQLRPVVRSFREGSVAAPPADSTDGLGIFFAKVGAAVALVLLLIFILGFSYNLFWLTLIGGIGFLLAVLLVGLILSEIPRWWKRL